MSKVRNTAIALSIPGLLYLGHHPVYAALSLAALGIYAYLSDFIWVHSVNH